MIPIHKTHRDDRIKNIVDADDRRLARAWKRNTLSLESTSPSWKKQWCHLNKHHECSIAFDCFSNSRLSSYFVSITVLMARIVWYCKTIDKRHVACGNSERLLTAPDWITVMFYYVFRMINAILIINTK